ncbi:MAG: phage scaffolding protein [Eubacterium sp.]
MAMTKEDLIKLGVIEETAVKIIADHTKEIQDEHQKTSAEKLRADNAETNLQTANAKLEGYDPEWKATVATAETKAQKQVDALKFDYAIKNALQGAKAKNTVAVKALLNLDGLKQNGDEIVGLKEQIDKIKTDNDYLFEAEEKRKPFMGSTNGAGTETPTEKDEANAAFRAVFGRE